MASFVSIGEVMIRDTAADPERLERTSRVHLSPAGSEFSVAVGLSRLGISSRFITRLPDNSYGRMIERIARGDGVDTAGIVWGPSVEPIGRYLYEPAVYPRSGVGTYQRMYSAASRLDPKDLDWVRLLQECRYLHLSGITFGLAAHSGYQRNYLAECFDAAYQARPAECLVGLDFNYRSTLWPKDEALKTLLPVVSSKTDLLIASIEDLQSFFSISIDKLYGKDGKIDPVRLNESELREVAAEVFRRFKISFLGLTKRYDLPDGSSVSYSFCFSRSGEYAAINQPQHYSVIDRLGGGDAWCAGLYYGLLTYGHDQAGLVQAVNYADAALRIQQTLMFDLPIFSKDELEQLIKDGGGSRIIR